MKKNIGITYSEKKGNEWQINKVISRENCIEELTEFILSHQDKNNILIAFDSPLGWPVKLSHFIYNHEIGKDPENDFSYKNVGEYVNRITDRVTYNILGKKPLSVGADRIAYTAFKTIEIIGRINKEIEHDTPSKIKLAKSPLDVKENKISMIEVYPGGTLEAYNINHARYKSSDADVKDIWQSILKQLKIETCQNKTINILNDHQLDSLICAFAGFEFLQGKLAGPSDFNHLSFMSKFTNDIHDKEGWIWCIPTNFRDSPKAKNK